jgi:hypothetical protein
MAVQPRCPISIILCSARVSNSIGIRTRQRHVRWLGVGSRSVANLLKEAFACVGEIRGAIRAESHPTSSNNDNCHSSPNDLVHFLHFLPKIIYLRIYSRTSLNAG